MFRVCVHVNSDLFSCEILVLQYLENKGLANGIKKMVERDMEELRKMPMLKRDTGDIRYSKNLKHENNQKIDLLY